MSVLIPTRQQHDVTVAFDLRPFVTFLAAVQVTGAYKFIKVV